MTNTNEMLYGTLIRTSESRGYGVKGRSQGHSKVIHALRVVGDNEGVAMVEPMCSPEDAGLPINGKTQSDVTCQRCLTMK